jgi:hypothetical protein
MNPRAIEITAFKKSSGIFSKTIAAAADRSPVSDGSACRMSSGEAKRIPLPGGAQTTSQPAAITRLMSERPDITGWSHRNPQLARFSHYAISSAGLRSALCSESFVAQQCDLGRTLRKLPDNCGFFGFLAGFGTGFHVII